MKTPHTIFKIAKLRSVIVLWVALALVAINAGPRRVGAKGIEASTTTPLIQHNWVNARKGYCGLSNPE